LQLRWARGVAAGVAEQAAGRLVVAGALLVADLSGEVAHEVGVEGDADALAHQPGHLFAKRVGALGPTVERRHRPTRPFP
jgi:hypothetical protein